MSFTIRTDWPTASSLLPEVRAAVRMVLRQGMMLAVAGVGIGLVVAMGLTRVMFSLLHGVEATDPLTYAVVPVVLRVVATLASFVPALRASRTDPLKALRFDA